MAKHEFGIMNDAPEKGKWYDNYEPQKYNCISIDDNIIENVDPKLSNIDFYWHTLDVKGKGLAYCGVTLIPPESTQAFIDAVKDVSEAFELRELMRNATEENKWIIHFGL